ncbi:MAG: primosomal protein N' [Alphaproteobacteria bacterium]|nr:primosomal protein N' [Alphaproteobacteria bacterium]
MVRYVNISLPIGGRPSYSYSLEEGQKGDIGRIVFVSFMNKTRLGIIIESDVEIDCAPEKIKAILEETLYQFSVVFLDFLKTVAGYTLSDFGSVLRAGLPSDDFLENRAQKLYIQNPHYVGKKTEKRQKILESFLNESEKLFVEAIEIRSGVSRQVIKSFIQQGGLIEISESDSDLTEMIEYDAPEFSHLFPAQKKAVQAIDAIASEIPVLLNGVTGSGKTEVYFSQVATALKEEKQILILLPEIALTSQFIQRFQKRFGRLPSFWHSGVSSAQKRKTWKQIYAGEEKVLIGTRSALFLPFKNLGLIVVDEEHDGSYKQEDQFIYHARDMAVLRAKKEKAKIILASATPSFESLANVQEGRYKEVLLNERIQEAVLPKIELIDLKNYPPEKVDGQKGWLSPVLVQALEETFTKKQQALLFLNRRGYAPLMICQKCGYRAKCPNCDVHLVYHQGSKYDQLMCHHCGYQGKPPQKCPQCEEEESFVLCGPGIDRLAEEFQKRFPTQRFLVMSSETTSTSKQLENALKKVENKEVDCLVGTQILTKGHHFPGLTCVGIVDADMSLMGADFRASEKTLQILEQTSGRAGREDEKGYVYIQTYSPDHPVMQALLSGDKKTFIQTELEGRKLAEMPPYGSLIALIISAKNEKNLKEFCRQIHRQAPQHKDVLLFGPADASIRYLRGRYRKRFLIQSPRGLEGHRYVKQWLNAVKIPSAIQIKIDVNPYSFI